MNVTIPNGYEAQIILPNNEIYNPFSVDTPIIDIMKNEEGKKIIK